MTARQIVYVVEILDGAEYDSWVIDTLWSTRELAEAYAKKAFQQSEWGSPVPQHHIEEYTLDEGRWPHYTATP